MKRKDLKMYNDFTQVVSKIDDALCNIGFMNNEKLIEKFISEADDLLAKNQNEQTGDGSFNMETWRETLEVFNKLKGVVKSIKEIREFTKENRRYS